MSGRSIAGKVGKFNVCFREDILSNHVGLISLGDLANQSGVGEVLDAELRVSS